MYKLPKNIRQIGQVGGNRKIYVEDYVITFTKQLVQKEYGNYSFAILLGNYAKLDGCRNIFIYGAVEIKDMVYGETINFSNDVWTSIYDNIKKYFTDTEVVGWYIGGAGLTLEIDEKILKAQKENFAGQDKVLFMYDSIEQEDAFFLSEGSNLKKQQGYYIYYERNEEMQNYMIERQGGKSSEEGYEDKATKEMRQVIEGKREEVDSKRAVKVLYAVSSVFAVIVLIIAATMFKNYDQLNNMQDALETISNNIGGDSSDKEDVTEVETVNGDLTANGQDNKDADSQDNQSSSSKTGDDNKAANNTKDDNGSSEDDTNNDQASNSSDNNNQNDNNANSDDTDSNGSKASSNTDNNDGSNTDDSNSDSNKNTDSSKNTNSDSKDSSDDANSDNDSVPASTNGDSVEKTNQYYIVQKGDTLATISLKFYDSIEYVNKIMDLNNIEDQDHIIIGQKLILP